ncbi:MAG: phosphoadenylyl-sulfate reductase [Flavobacteriales bacterium]|nr:phosphoadenylyl-sulfate reductase [Flavobacteriales bacterium]
MENIKGNINLDKLNNDIKNLSLEDAITLVSRQFEGKKVFSTSFGIEDQLLTHVLNELNLNIEVFTLDTGRLFEETYNTFHRTQEKYKNISIKTYFPLQSDIDTYIRENGVNGFYNSVEQRKECCRIRKVVPLGQALQDAQLWITGIRAEQSDNRQDMNFLEFDEKYQLVKFNPLLNWKLEEVEDFVYKNTIPFISLYKKGFKSIGCAPCTRAIQEGEDFRAGRWWWENPTKKECGLHE